MESNNIIRVNFKIQIKYIFNPLLLQEKYLLKWAKSQPKVLKVNFKR